MGISNITNQKSQAVNVPIGAKIVLKFFQCNLLGLGDQKDHCKCILENPDEREKAYSLGAKLLLSGSS